MMWPFSTKKQCDAEADMMHDPEAKRAIAQAREATQDADEKFREMRILTARIREQRKENHFSRAIWETMRQK